MKMQDKEVELFDYLKVIWKKKWIIFIGTALCVITAIVSTYIVTPVYEIDTIVQPAKFFIENQEGKAIEHVLVEEPQQIADKVRHNTYNARIAAQLGISQSQLPDFYAENIRDTLLARIWIRDTDVELSGRILVELIELIKTDIDEKIDVEISNIETMIRENEIEKQKAIENIAIEKEKLKILNQRKNDIVEEMKAVKKKIEKMEQEQLNSLKKERKSELEILGMLLYSNEILQSWISYDNLSAKYAQSRIEEENVNTVLQQEQASINKLENTIANLKQRKGRIERTTIVKEPSPSLDPVSPNKRLAISLAFVFGLLLFTIIAFLVEYIEVNKKKT
jgi:capsular polysaccharide biosynthesis protein